MKRIITLLLFGLLIAVQAAPDVDVLFRIVDISQEVSWIDTIVIDIDTTYDTLTVEEAWKQSANTAEDSATPLVEYGGVVWLKPSNRLHSALGNKERPKRNRANAYMGVRVTGLAYSTALSEAYRFKKFAPAFVDSVITLLSNGTLGLNDDGYVEIPKAKIAAYIEDIRTAGDL